MIVVILLTKLLMAIPAQAGSIDVYHEFCSHIAPPNRFDKNGIVDTEYLKRTLPGREVWFVKGLGGDIHDSDPSLTWKQSGKKSALALAERVVLNEDYMNLTSRQAVVSLGGRSRVFNTRTASPTEDSARDILCPAARDHIQKQFRLPEKDRKKLVLIGHSKGGRALLAMSKICPQVFNSPLIESVTTVGAPVGPSMLANEEKAQSAKACIEDHIYDNDTRSPDQRRRDLELFDMIRRLSSPDLGKPYSLSHLDTSEIKSSFSKKLNYVVLTWEKSCDAKRKIFADSITYAQCLQGGEIGDGRVAASSQSSPEIGQKLMQLRCVLHSDPFKVLGSDPAKHALNDRSAPRYMPLDCQRALNLWMLEAVLKKSTPGKPVWGQDRLNDDETESPKPQRPSRLISSAVD